MINEKKTNVVNFDEYKEILFHTFWCSDEITIVAKEFYDGFLTKKIFSVQVIEEDMRKVLSFYLNVLKKLKN